MIFDDWKDKSEGVEISRHLLWEYDLSDFDWQKMRTVVVGRVIERGWPDDYYAAIRLYGGLDNFREIIKEIPQLSPRDEAFVVTAFHIDKKDLRCYRRRLSRERHMNS